jgi:hypothetical protein
MNNSPLSEEEKKRRRAQDPKFNPFTGRTDDQGFLVPNGAAGGFRKPEGWSPMDPLPGYRTATED